MPAAPFVIDVSPHLTVTGAAVLDGSVPSADVAVRLHGLLAGERLVAGGGTTAGACWRPCCRSPRTASED
ncbi:hypothetical protein [Isoptericola croceus]|uniref:hypothetical protein n=1 Tax=Isoptericola croceus TaxID=3031406 RepID=UPI0023F926CE|nr:hypothetical protein [Isoptericola croceus]